MCGDVWQQLEGDAPVASTTTTRTHHESRASEEDRRWAQRVEEGGGDEEEAVAREREEEPHDSCQQGARGPTVETTSHPSIHPPIHQSTNQSIDRWDHRPFMDRLKGRRCCGAPRFEIEGGAPITRDGASKANGDAGGDAQQHVAEAHQSGGHREPPLRCRAPEKFDFRKREGRHAREEQHLVRIMKVYVS